MSERRATWSVERFAGHPAELHGLEFPEPLRPTVWVLEPDRPTVVLGSTQPSSAVDADAAAAAGVAVTRRRSGGSAVWLAPGDVVWIDVLLPRTDPRWVDDVGRSALWLGRAWASALHRLGAAGLEVHDGPMVRPPWSAAVCFAGVGPGEVRRGTSKIVGVSQRRTRAGARFQCSVPTRWDPAPLVAVLAPELVASCGPVTDLDTAAIGLSDLGLPTEAVIDSLIESLTRTEIP